MKKVTNVSGRPREIAATGQTVEPDATVEVDAELASALCEQPDKWAPARSKKTPTKEAD